MIRTFTLIFILFISSLAQGQLAIIGVNGETPDEVMLVVLEDIPAGEFFHLTDNEYIHSSDEFSTGEGFVTFSTSSSIQKGEVFSIKNDSEWSIEGSSDLSINSNTGSLNISMGNEQSYIYQTANNLFDGSISKILSVLDSWDGTMPSEINPIVNYPDAIVLDLPLNERNVAFSGSREFSDLSEIYDFSNWSLSQFRIDFDLTDFSNSALPVELSYFEGRNTSKGYALSWETLNEYKNDRFSIERSTNGSRFEELDYILGNGTTTSTNRYTYVDLNPANGLNYYRLKQIDYDGQFSVSEIIVFDNRKQIEFNIYPTLVKDEINVEFNQTQESEIKIYDESGRLILNVSTFTKSKTIDLSNLRSGIYYVTYYTETELKSQKFIKI